MSIEKVLQDLTDALKANTKALQELQYAAQRQAAPHEPIPSGGVAADPAPAKPAKAAKAPKAEAAPKAAPEQPKAEEPVAKVDYPAVTAEFNKLFKAKGREVAVAVLAGFGVNKCPELKPAQYAGFIEACQKAME